MININSKSIRAAVTDQISLISEVHIVNHGSQSQSQYGRRALRSL